MGNDNIPEHSQSLEKLYESKQYDQFVEQLKELKGHFSAKTYHYNLGTAYLKMEQPAISRFHLEKALQTGALHPSIYKNLQTAVLQLGVENAESSRYFKDNAMQFTMGYSLELTLALTLALAVFWLTLLRLRIIKKMLFTIGLTASLLPFLLSLFIQQGYQRAILLEPEFAYEGPSRSFEESSEIPEGTSIILKKDEGNWLYIVSPTHFAGWIDRSKLGIL